MTDILKKRWIIFGVIWGIVILLTCFNCNKINLIKRDREAAEILKKDRQFWINNSEKIAYVLKQKSSAFQNVESAEFGLLYIEDQLAALAIKNGLAEAKMTSGQVSQQGDASGAPIDFSFKGPFTGAMDWIIAFENNFPYLSVRKLKIGIDQLTGDTHCLVSFYYRVKISSRPDTG